tara:strand:+ start:234 stop:656 length:423 start_codon:yes stop_codon:yes gene_type:complete
MYRYKVDIVKVIDGDTVDVDIDLGFGMVYKKQRVRLKGIDTPESRTRNLEEKKFGLAAKAYLKEELNGPDAYTHIELVSHDKGKFGRILGELFVGGSSCSINQLMIDKHHAVPYDGQSKEQIAENHLKNRQWLTERGLVV